MEVVNEFILLASVEQQCILLWPQEMHNSENALQSKKIKLVRKFTQCYDQEEEPSAYEHIEYVICIREYL